MVSKLVEAPITSSLSVEASSAISAEAPARSEPPATEQIGGKALV